MKGSIRNDEPTSVDRLGRQLYAQAFAALATSCETPLVVGLYGGWGVGKTSLMNLISSELDESSTKSVWFDPWRHQFEDSPALSLVQTLVEELDLHDGKTRKAVTVIATALASTLMKPATALSLDDIDKLGKRYEDERFETRQAQTKLHDYFKYLIERARGPQRKRIVFFIDDLDRCLPNQILTLLEALKLYLNHEGCIYFIGVDHQALEQSIDYHYKNVQLSERKYLDKIVQLPFFIPPVAHEFMESFVEDLLTPETVRSKELLIEGLGDNPRQVKRFVNTFALSNQLAASAQIKDYRPEILALILLIQYRSPRLYARLIRDDEILVRLRNSDETAKALREEFLDDRLQIVLKSVELSSHDNLKPYIFLSGVSKVVPEESDTELELSDVEDVMAGTPTIPEILPKIRGWNLAGSSKLGEVGSGDFWGILNVHEEKFYVVFGDASGRGIQATVRAARVLDTVRLLLKQVDRIEEVVKNLNSHLISGGSTGQFYTLLMFEIDVKSGELSYINAGHEPARIVRGSGNLEELGANAPILGVFGASTFVSAHARLGKGDSLVAYSDGILEAMNGKNELYGSSRLSKILKRLRTIEPEKLVELLSEDMTRWLGTPKRADDSTIVVVQRDI